MTMSNIRLLAIVLAIMCAIPAVAQTPAATAPADATFAVEGASYAGEANGTGPTEAEAQNAARTAAVAVIMEALGKDRLFIELFLKNPPVTMTFKTLSSVKGAAGWTVRVRLLIDDESIRLLYNTAYVSTVVNLLDGAEARLSEAETLAADARLAEANGQLGRALSLYWQGRDVCDAGLDLLAPLGDAAVFSTTGKRKAPELREVLTAVRGTLVAGYERIKSAERGLAADEAMGSALDTLATVEADVAGVEGWAESIAPRLAEVEGTPRESLKALASEISVRRRALADARLTLSRVADAVPRDQELVQARVDVTRRRIDRTERYLAEARASVDREIRVPAMVRARRAQNWRWVFLHEPSYALSFRFYSPFGLDPGDEDLAFLDTGRFEYGASAEGAFGGDGGIWVRTRLSKDDAVLASSIQGAFVKNTGYTQTAELGFYGNILFGAGYGWDWLRRIDGDGTERKRQAIRLFLGGMNAERTSPTWLADLSWELPYAMGGFSAANVFNAGLDLSFRLGTAVVIEGGASFRARENEADWYDAVLRYSIGAGFRLPKPFLWGLEYAGHAAGRLGPDGAMLDAPRAASSYVRVFIEYSL